MERMEKETSAGMEIMNIKEWITSIFPVMSLSHDKKPDSKRTAVIQLVSLGKLSRNGLDELAHGDLSYNDRIVIRVGIAMLGAYEGVLMAEYGVSKSELLSAAEVLQMAKDLVEEKPAVEEKADDVA
jgi:hypothetical protein